MIQTAPASHREREINRIKQGQKVKCAHWGPSAQPGLLGMTTMQITQNKLKKQNRAQIFHLVLLV